MACLWSQVSYQKYVVGAHKFLGTMQDLDLYTWKALLNLDLITWRAASLCCSLQPWVCGPGGSNLQAMLSFWFWNLPPIWVFCRLDLLIFLGMLQCLLSFWSPRREGKDGIRGFYLYIFTEEVSVILFSLLEQIFTSVFKWGFPRVIQALGYFVDPDQ